ncbi:MAG TPA: rhodanese-like domain-containing protein, partial [Ilumatobacter sp.]|nr:rhodanese-like domain-containing protein [Ilumatobacter sp.]
RATDPEIDMFFKKIHQVAARDWESWVAENDAVVLDVREPHEWAQGILAGARKVQLTMLPDALASLEPTRPVLVVCRSGNRSQHAAKFLVDQGFANVANLSGGMRALGLAV